MVPAYIEEDEATGALHIAAVLTKCASDQTAFVAKIPEGIRLSSSAT